MFFWVVLGGLDPVELMNKLKGRVSQLHLKDLNAEIEVPSYGHVDKKAFEEIGDGVIDIEAIIETAAKVGVEHCHVEQDQSPQSVGQHQAEYRSTGGDVGRANSITPIRERPPGRGPFRRGSTRGCGQCFWPHTGLRPHGAPRGLAPRLDGVRSAQC